VRLCYLPVMWPSSTLNGRYHRGDPNIRRANRRRSTERNSHQNGTLTNILSSTENITTSFGGGIKSSFILSEYDFSEFDLPPDGKSLKEQFIGIDLAPSQSFRFVFGKFVPRDGTAAPGTYEIFTNQFGVGGAL